MTWDEAVALYVDEAEGYNSYLRDKDYFAWIGARVGALSIKDLDDDKLKALVAERRREFRYGKPEHGLVANSTVNYTVTHMVQRILRYAKSEGVSLPFEPRWKKHVLTAEARQREMVIDEEMLLETVSLDFWPFILFILETGLRKRAALILKSQVHWRQGVIQVIEKGGKAREIPITPEVAEILKGEWDKHPTHVFTYQVRKSCKKHTSGQSFVAGEYKPLIYSSVNARLQAICKKVGVHDLRIHDIRKTTGARIIRTTGDLKAASTVLNHANIETTAKHYAHITSDDVRRRLAQTSAETRRLKGQWAPEAGGRADRHPG